MKDIALLMFASISCLFAEGAPKVDPKTAQILNAVISDVIFGTNNKAAREFYGTGGDKTVILLDGSGLDAKPVKWPSGFKPEINGFTFVFGFQKSDLDSGNRDRRLAIRLDRFAVDFPERPDERKHPNWGGKIPICISIQNGGGKKNRAVIGGQTTWYAIAKKGQSWTVESAGAID